MFRVAAIGLGLMLAAPAIAAPPNVPTSLPYQGLLLDGLGAPRTGSVDLTVRIWDAVVGGTLVYKQSFPSVALADGVFTVQLGPTGDGTDAPSNPLTTSLSTALAGDAGATAPVRFVEVTVGAEGALSRAQILASAYAVRAASAATADSATDATNVAGVPGAYVNELFAEFNFDGGPPNYDPSEGLGDTDGDGALNFIDGDNDNDGIADSVEVTQGSDINLVTPTVISIAPTSGTDVAPTLVTVTGTSFQPGLTFAIGSQTPSVSNVTATSFQADVGPQAAGTVDLTVTLPNGQNAPLANAFTFAPQTLTGVSHAVTLGIGTANAAAFDMAVKSDTTEVLLAGYKQYGVGNATSSLAVHSLASRGSAGQIAVAFDASDRPSGLRCRDLAPSCAVEILTDTDADGDLEDETGMLVETLAGTATLESAQLERDPAGGWVAGYVRRAFSADAVVAHDRNGDGDFTDGNEIVAIEPGGSSFTATKSALAVDVSGHVAYAYFSSSFGVRLAWDRNGDGDYADTVTGNPELVSLPLASINCFDLAFDAAGHLALAYGGPGQTVARDLNGDGDFADVDETTAVGGTSSCPQIDAASNGQLAVAFATTLLVDRNGDGDFADLAERMNLSSSILNTGELKLNGTNRAIAVGTGNMFVGSTGP